MHDVVNPFDLSTIGSVPTADWEAVDSFLARAKELSEDRTAWMKTHERAAILKKAAAIMEERFDHLAMQVAAEGGKPLIDARVEVARAINGMELCIHELGALNGREIPMGLTAAGDGRIAWTMREPIGPVVAVSAFNHPLNLIVHQVAPAVATGCPVIVNTSFNVRGEPIVATPEDAYRCFMRTNMDLLVVEHAVMRKEDQAEWAEDEDWRSRYDD